MNKVHIESDEKLLFVKYVYDNKLNVIKVLSTTDIIVDENSKLEITIRPEKNIFVLLVMSIIKGLIDFILSLFISNTKKEYYRKFIIYTNGLKNAISIKNGKIKSTSKTKIIYIDFILDIISFLIIVIMVLCISYMAIIFGWFE